jgi:primosomal protein N'
LQVGDRVLVPWGLGEVEGEIVEVWGEPPAHVRVALELEDDEEPEVLLLNPRILTPLHD